MNIRDMTEPQLAEVMRRLLATVLKDKPDDVLGATLLIHTTDKIDQYVSSIRREDMILALRETAGRLEHNQDIKRKHDDIL